MTGWDHFVAELVAALLTWGLLLGGVLAGLVLAFLAGVGWERRRRWRAVEVQRAAFVAQSQVTVLLLTASARGGGR